MATPQYVLDLHGLRDALHTGNSNVLAGIEDGSIAIFRRAREDLEKSYPDLYDQFRSISARKIYIDISVGHKAAAAALLESYGASIFSAKPAIAAFHHLAASQAEGLVLISSGKGFADVQQIAAKCGIGHNSITRAADI